MSSFVLVSFSDAMSCGSWGLSSYSRSGYWDNVTTRPGEVAGQGSMVVFVWEISPMGSHTKSLHSHTSLGRSRVDEQQNTWYSFLAQMVCFKRFASLNKFTPWWHSLRNLVAVNLPRQTSNRSRTLQWHPITNCITVDDECTRYITRRIIDI